MSPEAHTLVHKFAAAHFDEGGQAQPSPSPSNPFETLAHSHVSPSTIAAGAQSTGLAHGGDVMGHQTRHAPNAKLGQVPNKDRYPNSTFHAAGGGEAPESMTDQKLHRLQDEMHNPAYTPSPAQKEQQDMNQTTDEKRNTQQYQQSQPIVQHFHFGGQASPQNFADGGSSFLQPPAAPPQDYVTAAPAGSSPPAQAAQAGAAPQAPPGPPNVPQDLMGEATAATNQTAGGIQKEAQAKGAESAQEAQAYGQEQPQLDAQTQRMEQNGQMYHEAWDKIANNTDPTIDPNHYWNSKDTGSKIISAIGFMLGGAGLGVSGHADLAGKAIQDAVNRDIDAQKATFTNKDNLLARYSDQYKSTLLGEDALRLQYGAQVENMIKRAAAQAGTPIAAAQAQQAIGNGRQQLVGNMSNLAQGQTAIDLANLKRQYINQPGGPGGGQQAQAPGAGMVDTQKLNQLQITGLMPQADVEAATKEAQGLEGTESLRQDYNNTYNQLNKKFLAGTLTPGDRQSAIWTLAGKLQHVSAGRFNLEDAKKQMDAMFPQMLDSGDTRKDRQQRGNALFDTMTQNTPTLDRYGVRRQGNPNSMLEGKTATGPNGQKIIMKGGKWVPLQ